MSCINVFTPFPGEELTCIGAVTASVRSCKNSFSLEPEAFIHTAQTLLARGRILGRNPDKSKSFPPCYSQSPVQFM